MDSVLHQITRFHDPFVHTMEAHLLDLCICSDRMGGLHDNDVLKYRPLLYRSCIVRDILTSSPLHVCGQVALYIH